MWLDKQPHHVHVQTYCRWPYNLSTQSDIQSRQSISLDSQTDTQESQAKPFTCSQTYSSIRLANSINACLNEILSVHNDLLDKKFVQNDQVVKLIQFVQMLFLLNKTAVLLYTHTYTPICLTHFIMSGKTDVKFVLVDIHSFRGIVH